MATGADAMAQERSLRVGVSEPSRHLVFAGRIDNRRV